MRTIKHLPHLRRRQGFISYILAAVSVLAVAAISTTMYVLDFPSSNASMRKAQLTRSFIEQVIPAVIARSADTDSDGELESPAWVSASPSPADGGGLPANIAGPKTDAWGHPFGYCTWDNGNVSSSTHRNNGDNPATQESPVFAILSAGPNGSFETTCANIKSGSLVAGSDDLVREVTLAEINQGTGGNSWFGQAMANSAGIQALPTALLTPGETRLAKDTNILWQWNGSSWVALSGQNTNVADAGRNALINGNFDIWQRGTSANVAANTWTYLADRWTFNPGGGAASLSRVGAQSPSFTARYALQIAMSAVSSSGSNPMLEQRVEHYETFSGQTVTLSFWARVTSGSATVTGQLVQTDSGSGGIKVCSGTLSGDYKTCTYTGTAQALTTAWQRFTQTFTLSDVSAGGGSPNGATYLAADLLFPLNTWFTVQVAQVQLEGGSNATAFDYRPFVEEMLLCMRYYEVYSSGAAGDNTSYYVSTGTSYTFKRSIAFRVPKRAAPTVTLTNITNSLVGTPSVSSSSIYGFIESRGTPTGTGVALMATNWTANAEL